MVHIIKVYFTGPKEKVQIRRLAVNSDVVSRFELLVRKIREMFPGFAQGHIEVTWKDFENDVIHMSSDEELAQALASADDDILRIYAYCIDSQQCEDRENQNFKSSHNEAHQNVICDGCDKTIHGYRYKCLQCRNFDLCSGCNAANKHENHDMIKLVRPAHITRDWVFPGARKIWRSMFGRSPRSFFASSAPNDENREDAKSESKKNQWPGIINDLLKGDYVSVDKLVKENLGGFLNFIDSVSVGNLEVKLEGDHPKPTFCTKNQDNKTDRKTNKGTSNSETTFAAASCQPAEPLIKECSKSTMTKTAEQSSNSASSDVAVEKEKENFAKPCGLFNNKEKYFLDLPKEMEEAIDYYAAQMMNKSKTSMGENSTSATGDSIEQKQTENSAKPCGLFGDNESSDGWTILHKQEDEKKDVASGIDNGAKPKYPNIYPSVPEMKRSSDDSQANAGNVNAETNFKEASSVQTDVKVFSKPAEDEDDKCAKLEQNENVYANLDPEIIKALMKMQAMGFTNEGGWLERLLVTKDGNINATLDALYPNTRRH